MFAEQIIEKNVKAFLDIIILAILNGKSTYGYKLIASIHREFGVLLSPGSLYPLLHMLEDKKLIESKFQRGKIVYTVTSKGKKQSEKTFKEYGNVMQRMNRFIETHSKRRQD